MYVGTNYDHRFIGDFSMIEYISISFANPPEKKFIVLTSLANNRNYIHVRASSDPNSVFIHSHICLNYRFI